MSDVFCNKCGFSGQADERGNHKRPSDGEVCHYVARTRPQPSAEAVAYLYERGNLIAASRTRLHCGPSETETPLYPASALEAARREALEQAAKVAEAKGQCWTASYTEAANEIATAIHALKENPNAG